jgi:hypothetical protein
VSDGDGVAMELAPAPRAGLQSAEAERRACPQLIADRLAKSDIQANANLSIARAHDDEEDPMTFESHNPASGVGE